MKNSTRKPKGGLIKRYYLTHILIGHAQSHLFYKHFCKKYGFAWRDFPTSGGQPKATFFQTYTKTITGSLSLMEQRIFAFSLIIEGTTEKVLQFIMPLKSIYNRNFGFIEQIMYFWTTTESFKEEKLY